MMLLLLAALLGGQPSGGSAAPYVPPCSRLVKDGGTTVFAYIGDRACVDLKPPERMEGVWLDAFEGSAFIKGATRVAPLAEHDERTWLTLDEESRQPPDFEKRPRRHAWRLVIIGREAKDMHRKPLNGYGHMSMSAGLVVVDRVVSAVDLGPLGQF